MNRATIRMSASLLLTGLAAAATLAGPSPAQRVLRERRLTTASLNQLPVAGIGDLDGDGTPDLLASSGTFVEAASGRDGRVLWRTPALFQLLAEVGEPLIAVGDLDRDGTPDFAVLGLNAPSQRVLRLHSGATGATIRVRTDAAMVACAAGDVDGDGFDDYATAASQDDETTVEIREGSTDRLLHQLRFPVRWSAHSIHPIGDLSGDGRTEFVVGLLDRLVVVGPDRSTPIRQILRTDDFDFGEHLSTADFDGDGIREAVVTRSDYRDAPRTIRGRIEVHDLRTGAVRHTLDRPEQAVVRFDERAVAVDDLDGDGVPEILARIEIATFPSNRGVAVFSGSTGKRLWTIENTSTWSASAPQIAVVGDVDADGVDDALIGYPNSQFGGGWRLVSSRIRATVESVGGACGGGPFLPELGMTRPLLGRTASVVCRDGAANANGVLVVSLKPQSPTDLGGGGCTAWFDVGSWTSLHTASTPAWSLPLPIPADPRLAGVELAMQVVYGPTVGLLGFDLSNGIHAKLGD